MKKINTKVTKSLLSITMIFAMIFNVTPTNVFAETNTIEVATTDELLEAITDPSNGATIKIMDNIDLSNTEINTPENSNDLTIDLNGMELKGYMNNFKYGLIKHNGTGILTIKDSSSSKQGKICFDSDQLQPNIGGSILHNAKAGTITVENGTYEAILHTSVIFNNTNGTINILGGTLKSVDNSMIISNGDRSPDAGTINIKGGDLHSTGNGSVVTSSMGKYATLNIDGATLVSEMSKTIDLQAGELNISESDSANPTSIKISNLSNTSTAINVGSYMYDTRSQMIISGGKIVNEGLGSAIETSMCKTIINGSTNIISSTSEEGKGSILISYLPPNWNPKTDGYLLDIQGGSVTNSLDNYAVYINVAINEEEIIDENNVNEYYKKGDGAIVGKVYPKAKELIEYTGTQAASPNGSKSEKTETSITLNNQVITSETVEYGYSTTNTEPTSWQDGNEFTDLKSNTEYYFFARVKANTTHKAGKSSNGTMIKTAMSADESLATAKSLAEEAIKKLTATNKTTDQNILDAVSTGISSIKGVKASWKATPTITLATNDKAGSITGTIILTVGNENVEITVNKDINKLVSKDSIVDDKTGVKIEYEDGSTFDSEIKLVVTPKSKEELKQYQDGVDKVSKGMSIGGLYDIKLLKDGVEIQPDGKLKISLALTAEMKEMSDLQVIYIDDNGNVIIIPSKLIDGKLAFVTEHFSYYGVIGKEKATGEILPENPSNPIPPLTENPSKPSSPLTGDTSNILLYLGAIMLSGCLIGFGYKKVKSLKK